MLAKLCENLTLFKLINLKNLGELQRCRFPISNKVLRENT